MENNEIWPIALGELQLQMTQATFDTWLKPTKMLGYEDGVLVVGCGNEYAREWLTEQLGVPIQRTVASIAEDEVRVMFVVGEGARNGREQSQAIEVPEAPARGFVRPDFDTHRPAAGGWFPVSGYENLFWPPLLGRVAWRVWEIVRREDKRKKKSEWTPAKRWSAPKLSMLVPCGVQAVVGVYRQCAAEVEGAVQVEDGSWRRRQQGAFDKLQVEEVATVRSQGDWRHRTYLISVHVKLALLTPVQVARLPVRLQLLHEKWLEQQNFDPRDWDVGDG